MKKTILALVFFLALAGQASAAGIYDGIWAMYYGGSFVLYESIHQNGDQIIAIALDPDLTWDAVSGILSGNTVSFSTLVGGVQSNGNVVFTSPSTMTVTQTSCYPVWQGYHCLLPNGAVVTGQKIF